MILESTRECDRACKFRVTYREKIRDLGYLKYWTLQVLSHLMGKDYGSQNLKISDPTNSKSHIVQQLWTLATMTTLISKRYITQVKHEFLLLWNQLRARNLVKIG